MKRRLLASFLLTWMLLTLTACGGGAKSETSMDLAATTVTEDSAEMDYGGGVEYEEASTVRSESGTAQKLICTARLEMETTEFDTAAAELAELTERFGGYFESGTIGNQGGGYRWAEYTIRVPAEQYQAFLNQAGQLCHETWRSTSQQDVTEFYYDTEGRLKTQQIKLERLQALLARAEDMEDIITIESAISETEWTIEELSGTLRHYDALVDYATVNLCLSEVYKLSNAEGAPDSFGGRLGAAFSGGWRNFVDAIEDLVVGFAYSWMWWLALAVLAVLAVHTVRKRKGKLRLGKKKEDDSQDAQEKP